MRLGARFHCAQCLRVQPLHRHAIGLAAFGQCRQTRPVRLGACEHQFAAALQREVAFLTICLPGAVAVAGQARLEGVGGIINAAVQYAAVAPAGMLAGCGFLFRHHHAGLRVTALDGARHAQADDAGADD